MSAGDDAAHLAAGHLCSAADRAQMAALAAVLAQLDREFAELVTDCE